MPKINRSGQSGANFDLLFGVESGPQQLSGLMLLSRDSIQVAPQARTRFPREEIAELAASIRELREAGQGIEGTGLLQPLLVRPGANDTYTLIAGERRLRAAGEAGLSELPCLVTSAGEEVVPLLQIVENLQRAGLHPLDEARGLETLLNARGLTVRDAAKLLGKDKNYVSNRLRLLKMKPDVQELVSRRADTLVHAQVLDGVQDAAERALFIQAVADESLSVAELRRRIQGEVPKQEPREEYPQDPTNGDNGPQLAVNGNALSLRRDKIEGVETGTEPTGAKRHERGTSARQESGQNPARVENEAPDPLATAIQPASALLAEAARQLHEMKPSGEYAGRVTTALDALKTRIAAIEKTLNAGSQTHLQG